MADAAEKNGVNTFEQLDALFKLQLYQSRLRKLELAIEENNNLANRNAALKPITDKDTALRNDKAALIEQINAIPPV